MIHVNLIVLIPPQTKFEKVINTFYRLNKVHAVVLAHV